MWSRWCSSGLLRQRVTAIVNVSQSRRFHIFDPPLLGMRDFGVECGRRRKGEVKSLSLSMMSQFKRGISSSSPSTSDGDRNSDNSSEENGGSGCSNGIEESPISLCEAKKLMRLVNVESLKMKLGMEGKEVISYCELLEACESMGVVKNSEEAAAFAKVLDDAGDILLFRDKVYLHPRKIYEVKTR